MMESESYSGTASNWALPQSHQYSLVICAAIDETTGEATGRAMGFAYVRFDSVEGAANALMMNGQDFGGCNMMVSPLPEQEAEVPITNSNLACSMAQLGSLQLDPPGSAAGIEAETETVPLSPSASVAPSITESFFVVE